MGGWMVEGASQHWREIRRREKNTTRNSTYSIRQIRTQMWDFGR